MSSLYTRHKIKPLTLHYNIKLWTSMYISNSIHRAINDHTKYFSIYIIIAFKTLLTSYYLLTRYTATNVIIIVVKDNNNNSESPLVWNIMLK